MHSYAAAAVGCSGYSMLAVIPCFSTCPVDLGPLPTSPEFIPAYGSLNRGVLYSAPSARLHIVTHEESQERSQVSAVFYLLCSASQLLTQTGLNRAALITLNETERASDSLGAGS